MSDPLRLAAALVEIAATYIGRRQGGRGFAVVILNIVAAITAVAALVFAFVALWAFALPVLGRAAAALIMAGVLLLLSLIALVVGHFMARSQSPKSEGRDVSRDLEALLTSSESFARKHKSSLLVAAVIAGVLLGETSRNDRKR